MDQPAQQTQPGVNGAGKPALAAPPLGDDQAGFLEHAQVLHHRAAVELGEMRDERAGGQRLVLQIVEHPPARLMAERLEDPVMLLGNPGRI